MEDIYWTCTTLCPKDVRSSFTSWTAHFLQAHYLLIPSITPWKMHLPCYLTSPCSIQYLRVSVPGSSPANSPLRPLGSDLAAPFHVRVCDSQCGFIKRASFLLVLFTVATRSLQVTNAPYKNRESSVWFLIFYVCLAKELFCFTDF